MKVKKKILIAGVGNLLFTDEGIGVHIIKELSKIDLPEYIELAEIGTAAFELLRFMEGKDKVIIIDAIISNELPGTIYKLTPDELKKEKTKFLTSLHQYGILDALESSSQMGNKPETIILGITPKDYKTLGTELTPELNSSIKKIIKTILKEIK
jgi:hydrogenase maturation protease